MTNGRLQGDPRSFLFLPDMEVTEAGATGLHLHIDDSIEAFTDHQGTFHRKRAKA